MRSLISWTVRNMPAMNTLVVAILIVGAMSFAGMRREVFPEFELEIILVNVPYPGATPEEVEEGICQKVEEACRSVSGIKKLTSVAQEGAGFCVFELDSGTKDVQKVLSEIRSEVERIPSLPELSEDPKVEQITLRNPAIKVGVLAPRVAGGVSESELRDVAELIRDDLLALPAVSAANLQGARDYEIDIEIYYDSKHSVNIEMMLNAVERSLKYYTENFGPYYHKQCRIIEFPRFSNFAQAFPGTMPYSESFGFIIDLEDADDNNVIDAVIAHEMAHQWWAHQVVGADMQGGTLLSESFSEYSSLMTLPWIS